MKEMKERLEELKSYINEPEELEENTMRDGIIAHGKAYPKFMKHIDACMTNLDKAGMVAASKFDGHGRVEKKLFQDADKAMRDLLRYYSY